MSVARRDLDKRQIYHIILGVVIGMALLGLIWLRLKDQDVYSVSVTDPGYVTGVTAENGDRILAQGCEQIYLYPGTYRLAIRTSAADANIYVQVYDKWGNHVLAEQAYEEDAAVQVITFTTDTVYEKVVVRSLTSDPTLDQHDLQIEEYILESNGRVCKDAMWSIGLILLLAVLFYIGYRRVVRKGRIAFLVLTAASALTALPFYSENLQAGHDLFFHLTRISNIARAMSEGRFPEQLNTMAGGGSIIPIMYPEALLYGAGFMVSSGATVFLAYKVLCACITFASAYVAYYAARQVVDERPALLFAILWLINPFRMNELLVRAALGEALAIVFLPLIAVGMWQMFHGSCKWGTVHLVIGYTGLLASHMLTLVIVACFCAVFVVGQLLLHPQRFLRELYRVAWLALAAVITVLVNMYFLLPFLSFYGWDLHLSNGENSAGVVQESTAPLWQLFMGAVGYGDNIRTTEVQGEMPISVGPALLLAIVVWLIYVCYRRYRLANEQTVLSGEEGMVWHALAISLCAVFMASRYFPWDFMIQHSMLFTKTLGSMQFAWRIMMIPACLLSFLLAAMVDRMLSDETAYGRMVVMGLLTVSLASAIVTATNYYSEDHSVLADHFDNVINYNVDYITEDAYRDHYVDLREWLMDECRGPLVVDDMASVTIAEYHRSGTDYTFQVTNSGDLDVTVTVPVFWYGMHHAYLESEAGSVEIACTQNAEYQLSDVCIPAGTKDATVRLAYERPVIFGIAYGVSAISIIAVIAIGVVIYRRRKAVTA